MKSECLRGILGTLPLLAGLAAPASGQAPLDRTALPIAEPKLAPITELDARNVRPPPRFEVKAPEGAPNVVIVLIDDLGFGSPSTFGGPIRMPTLDRLAEAGLRYNNFHTTALCSPTRVALKSGRNHHTANAGSVMEIATAFPGNTGQVPNRVAPLAEMLRLNGFSTAAFGKWHETAPWETSVSGPYDRWPIHQGFDKFYGFIGGETNQWSPLIFDGVQKIEPPSGDPDYHFTTDMADQAIQWVRAQQSLTPESPSSSTSHPARRTRRTTCRRPGRTGTRDTSTRAGTRCARRPSSARRSWGWFRPTAGSPRSPRRSRPGMR